MKISELIAKLEKIKKREGDIEVRTQSLSHTWPPDLKVKRNEAQKWVLLND